MRDLRVEELVNVYGAGGKGRNDCSSSGKGSKSCKAKSSKRKCKSSARYC